MKLSKLLSNTHKEWPADTVSKSHGFLIKGGYIRQVTSGIYSYLPLAQMISLKIIKIIREEMNNIDCMEVLLPVVMSKELWEESGRYDSISDELLRFEDRTGHGMVLGMTHEEAVVHLARTEATTYTKYPFALFQIQTKFRDEARSRGGLIRTREFLMKDAYSFHTTQESLDEYYQKCYDAYFRIFRRVGLKNFIAVESDTGMMGGMGAHEFMLLCDIGEDSLAICPNCGYSANVEVAEGIIKKGDTAVAEVIEEVDTPEAQTIEQLQEVLNLPKERLIKACVFDVIGSNKPLIVFIRGDLEVNEAKLKKVIGADIKPRTAQEDDGICYGFIGPIGLELSKCDVIYDISLKDENNLVCGANKLNKHLVGVNIKDLAIKEFKDVYKANADMLCPVCKKAKFNISHGIEIGNIFKLGNKYTKAMHMTYTAANGREETPIMGCYGIGIGRLIASVLEEHNDDHGPIWPISVAPFCIHIIAIKYHDEKVNEYANKFYKELSLKYDVVLDDRDLSAGVQFADADLIGAPVRLIISAKSIANNEIEIVTRDRSLSKKVAIANVVSGVEAMVDDLMKKCEGENNWQNSTT